MILGEDRFCSLCGKWIGLAYKQRKHGGHNALHYCRACKENITGPRIGLDHVMTFKEIGKRLGISTQLVHHTYLSALKKLRKYYSTPERREELRELLAGAHSSPGAVHQEDRSWPDISAWTIHPVHSTSNWKERALQTLENYESLS